MLQRIALALLFCIAASPAWAAAVGVTIDLSDQRMDVSVAGKPAYSWDVSTGKAGYRTPTGTFSPTRMYVRYFSKKYDNAPMPYSIFFYGGYAIHGTTEVSKLGTPASHGCVRLAPEHARLLFDLVKANGMKSTKIRIRA